MKISSFFNVSLDWLVTGEGAMLRNVAELEEAIPLLSVEKASEYDNVDVVILEHGLSERYIVPDFNKKGVKYLIRVSGNSMSPKYSNGDVLACRPVSDAAFFQWGKVYVLYTDQGPLVKRLYQGKTDDTIECRSDNAKKYPLFQISKSSILSMAIVVGVIKLQ